jgi:hypothetical protein
VIQQNTLVFARYDKTLRRGGKSACKIKKERLWEERCWRFFAIQPLIKWKVLEECCVG